MVERVITGAPAARRARRLLMAGALAAAAGVAGAVALLPSTGEKAVASWTAMPTGRSGADVLPQARICAANDVGGGTSTARASDVLVAEQRGEATLLVMRKNATIVECLQVGDTGVASMSLIDEADVVAPPAGTVTLETSSSFGDDDEQMSNMIGLAAPDVTAVTLRLAGGGVITASVTNGWWAAWWPGPEGGDLSAVTVNVQVGETTTAHLSSDLP
ncbi:hypothetical protein Acsp01_68980 [Actinoplanes sp. NBRC 101535]|nr:hypothetical protein Acsp01_68980 [Actinoplanes sp. NBRC 101535]